MAYHGTYAHIDFDAAEGDFSWPALYAPQRFDGFRDRVTSLSIAVLGGGLAGLAAAYELVSLGHRVTIFEASDRIGGRVRTHRFSDGQYGELGPMRIPDTHASTLHYIRKFGLQLRTFVSFNDRAYYHLRGVRTRIRDWRDIAREFRLTSRFIRRPDYVFEQAMRRAYYTLTSNERWDMFRNQLPAGRLRLYDNMTLRQFLETSRFSDEAIQYACHANGMIHYERSSFLETYIDYFGLYGVETQHEIIGGMDLLPKAFYAHIQDEAHRGGEADVRLGTSVTGVKVNSAGVEIRYKTPVGWDESLSFDYAVCTLPAPLVATLEFDPALPPRQLDALRRVSYASAAKTLMNAPRRFWEINDGIAGGGTFTDMPIQQVWYPSDNALPEADGSFAARTTGEETDESLVQLATWVPADDKISQSAGVLTAAYMWETNARRFAASSDASRDRIVRSGIERLHPGGTTGHEELVHHVWDNESSPGHGAFAFFGPGEHRRFQDLLCQPYNADGHDRVFFAGEHLSIAHAWMQGAIQSGLAATADLLSTACARGARRVAEGA